MERTANWLTLPPAERLEHSGQQAAQYLRRSHADPEDPISFKDFCTEGIDIYQEMILASYGIRNPQQEAQLRVAVTQALSPNQVQGRVKLEREPYTLSGGSLIMPHTKANKRPTPNVSFEGIIASGAYLSPLLPRFDFAWVLDTKADPHLRNDERGQLGHFNRRYWMFKSESGLPYSSPEVKMMSLVFLEELAKISAIDAIKNPLEAMLPKGTSTVLVTPPQDPELATQYVIRRIDNSLKNQEYLSLVRRIQKELIASTDLTSEITDVLYDFAFFRKGDLPMGQMTQLLAAQARVIGLGNLDEALASQLFLRRFFIGSFPDWKKAEFEEAGGESVPGIGAFLDKTASDPALLNQVPRAFDEIFLEQLVEVEDAEEANKMRQEQREEKNKELQRLEATMFDAIVRVSHSQADELGGKPFDTSKPISDSNPLSLKYLVLYTQGRTNPTTIAYTSLKTSGEAETIQLQTKDEKYFFTTDHPLSMIIKSLIYQDLLTPELFREAAEEARRNGQLKETDSLQTLFQKSVSRYMKHLGKLYVTQEAKNLADYKRQKLEAFIAALA